jgi:hypothetical protein
VRHQPHVVHRPGAAAFAARGPRGLQAPPALFDDDQYVRAAGVGYALDQAEPGQHGELTADRGRAEPEVPSEVAGACPAVVLDSGEQPG